MVIILNRFKIEFFEHVPKNITIKEVIKRLEELNAINEKEIYVLKGSSGGLDIWKITEL